jgi:hypothetical protein
MVIGAVWAKCESGFIDKSGVVPILKKIESQTGRVTLQYQGTAREIESAAVSGETKSTTKMSR